MTVEVRREQQTFIDTGFFGIVINKYEVAYTIINGTSHGGFVVMKNGDRVDIPSDDHFKHVTDELLINDGTIVSYRT